MLRPIALTIAACALSFSASASSPDAWSEHEKTVVEACLAASGLQEAKAHTSLIVFDDSVGYDALIVTGNYPQDHMKGKHGEMLCLYDKKAAKALVSEFQHR